MFRKNKKLSNQGRNQKRFHVLHLQNCHNRIFDWEIAVKDHAKIEKSFTGTINTNALFGLNESDAYAAY